ncbi:MAG: alginate lyase family protein [Desulfobulbaceae bacterium]|nr:alginate lyase family protein [Desulfobulbaceae bacterium]
MQIYGRAWFKFYHPSVDLSPAPALRPLLFGWIAPVQRQPTLREPFEFCFLNELHGVVSSGDWDDPSISKLWRYNLHYFDDLNAKGAQSRISWHQKLLLRWVQENTPGQGTGWEPYPTSLRIVNWIKWAWAGNVLPPECLQSLAVQVRWVLRRLEIHLQGNHLIANAKALVFAGLFFSGPEARKWLKKGLGLLSRQLPEQILGDGGQFERSTMYHALALEDMLDLCNATATVSQESIPMRWRVMVEGWRETVTLMRQWLALMCHPDGEIGLFNDAAFGIAPSQAELECYAKRLGLSSLPVSRQNVTHLENSGYVRVQLGPMTALLDVAIVGPRHLPAHGHADTLSFELSLFGQRLLVNSGTSCYGASDERLRQRGTAAHNTVVIDGQDSSEVWGGFRVARRARPTVSLIQEGERKIIVDASHDGYQRLPGENTHRRRWSLSNVSLIIEDEILGSFRNAEARFHLHPHVKSDGQKLHEGQLALQLPQGQDVNIYVMGGAVRLDTSTWHPHFGISEHNLCLVVTFQSSRVRTEISW